MVQLLLEVDDLELCSRKLHQLDISSSDSVQILRNRVSEIIGVEKEIFEIVAQGGIRCVLLE
jgi:hypothetical protein